MAMTSIIFYIGCALIVYDNIRLKRKLIALLCVILFISIGVQEKLNVSLCSCIFMGVYVVLRIGMEISLIIERRKSNEVQDK